MLVMTFFMRVSRSNDQMLPANELQHFPICGHLELNPGKLHLLTLWKRKDIRDDSRVLPMEVMWIALLYGFKGSIMIVSFCFCIDNIEEAVDSHTGQPYIQVLFSAMSFHARATIHGGQCHYYDNLQRH